MADVPTSESAYRDSGVLDRSADQTQQKNDRLEATVGERIDRCAFDLREQAFGERDAEEQQRLEDSIAGLVQSLPIDRQAAVVDRTLGQPMFDKPASSVADPIVRIAARLLAIAPTHLIEKVIVAANLTDRKSNLSNEAAGSESKISIGSDEVKSPVSSDLSTAEQFRSEFGTDMPVGAESLSEELGTPEVAAYLNADQRNIRTWVLQGKLPSTKKGRDLRYRKIDVLRFDETREKRKKRKG